MREHEAEVFAIRQPDPALFRYYVLASLLAGPLFLVPLIPLFFRYHTLRYQFDSEGISMRWGILFRREITLTYARIQDIHLVSNLVERWLGLARVQIQTASGSTSAEMTLEGIREFAMVRDYLYGRMRGISTPQNRPAMQVGTLGEIAREMRSIRELLAKHFEGSR
jgi:membrane protein YdbS with pleckstrin-like domain